MAEKQTEIFTAFLTVNEAELVAEALSFWASDYDGVETKERLDLARTIAAGFRGSGNVNFAAVSKELLERDGSIVLIGINPQDRESIAEVLRESAEFGTEFDDVLQNVADQFDRAEDKS